ncbi:karyopherin [Coemansia sp. RSA 1646]|nr:karyopherin [Coemansia sp. RSA 1646]KAJ1772750.1 karyopherin [Coemansia sp. RSA 1843]KAJ2090702.1 karyopherin [Coemansia sp. RSA 986]KAJ2216093.1 karyopherin [Coemansia sp. RSA 487]
MNKQTIEQVVYMLQLVHSADTTENRRKEAHEFCQRLKDSPDALNQGVELASSSVGSGLPPQVQHFGLQLIEHVVRHHYRSGRNAKSNNTAGKLGTDEMLQLRDQLWRMIFEACERQTAAYIKEKLVAVMVQLIIRLWPSVQWCNLNMQLMQLYSSSSLVHREMALRIWKTLGEEMFVYDRDAMATVRKSDLINGIIGALLPKAVVVELYPTGYRMSGDADDTSNTKKALPIVLEPGNEDGWLLRWATGTADAGSMDEQQLVGLVDTIGVFMDWVPVKALGPTQVVPRLGSLLQTSSSDTVRLRAAAALEVISRRIAVLGEERDMVILEFAQNYDGAVAVAMGDTYRSTLPPAIEEAWTDTVDALTFAKSVSQICSNLVTLQWARKKLEINILPHPERFLELLMALCKDRRLTVASVALSGWGAIIKHGTLSRAPSVTAAFSTLTEHATTALFSVCRSAHLLSEAISKGATLGNEAIGIDEDEVDQFESLAELRMFLNSELRTRLLAIIRGMCDLDPAGFVGWILPSLVPVFAAQQQGSSSDIGHVSVIEAAFMTVDAILSTLDDAEQRALAESDDDAVAAIRKARAPCYELGRRVVQFDIASTALTTRQLNTLPSFAFLLRRPAVESSDEARELMFMVLQKCTSYLGASSAQSMSGSTREARNVARRATAAMVRLAVAIPDSLMLIYQDLSQLVQSRMADPNVAGTIKSYLGEFQLALVSGATVRLAERKELARPIIQPLIESLNGFVPALQSPETFMSMLLGLPALDQAYAHNGETLPSDAKQALDGARGARNGLSHVLSTLHIYLNRTLGNNGSSDGPNLAPLWIDYVSELVPPIMRLVQCVQSLWNPVRWQHLPWQSAQAQRNLFGLLEISTAERLSIIGVSDTSHQEDQHQQHGTKEQRLDLETRAVYHTLSVFREYAYKCLGKCARLPEMFDPKVVPDPAAQFTSCLFADAESMSARHWRILLADVIRPVLDAVGNWPGLNSAQMPSASSSAQTHNMAMVAGFVPVWLEPLFSFCTQRLQTEWRELLARGAVLTSKEDIAAVALGKYAHQENDAASGVSVDDDIVHEKMLRDWTRSWSQLVADLLADMAEWIPEATQIEHELLSSSQVSATNSGDGNRNRAVGAFILNSCDVFATTLSTALGALQYKDTQSVQRVLLSLARVAPSLVVVALLPMYVPPTQQHAAIVSAYMARMDRSLVKPTGHGCSSVFTWLATDLVNVLVGVLRDSALIDLQPSALGLLADLVYFSAAISSRMPRSWTFRNSSGSAGNGSPSADAILPVGDPGLVFRRAMHETILPALQASGITSDDFEHSIAQLTSTACDAKHRKAIIKVALQPMLAVEKSQLFDDKNK